jgi:AraC family transcriptional regulator, transcriptional activator of pobA
MNKNPEIPIFNAQNLWDKYVDSPTTFNEFFVGKPDNFMVLRLEEFRGIMRLPTVPHRKNSNELVFVTKGKSTRGSNLNLIEVNEGEVHLHLANQISSVEYLSDDLEGFFCQFSVESVIQLYHTEHTNNELAWLSQRMQTKSIKLNDKVFDSVKTIFERIYDEYRTTNEPKIIDAYLVTLFYEIKNSIETDSVKSKQSKSFDLTEQFKNLIQQHINQHQSIGFYADLLKVSPNHLNKIVKQATGKQASALIAEMLILEAKVLLKHTDLSMADIAFKLGFNDQSYFSRFFKKHSGISPKEYKL